jgi:hypothetical protein
MAMMLKVPGVIRSRSEISVLPLHSEWLDEKARGKTYILVSADRAGELANRREAGLLSISAALLDPSSWVAT